MVQLVEKSDALQNLCNTYEIVLRRSLQADHAPPFIGLLDLSDSDRERAKNAVRTFIAGEAQRLILLLKKRPLLATWAITNSLSESYGFEDSAVYAPIQSALGVALPAQGPMRRNLYRHVEQICRRFSLPIVSHGRMVDLYLVQAGISQPQIPHVVEAFLRAERAFGSPPTDATATLNSWEDDALTFLHPGLSIPRLVLEADETGYHAALFARLRRGEAPKTAMERAFAAALEANGSGRSISAPSGVAPPQPRLMWVGGALCLSVPRLEGRLAVGVEGQVLRLRGGRDWPVPQPWPGCLTWRHSTASGSISILESRRSLLVFDAETGKQLTEVSPRATSYEIDGCRIMLISREEFTVRAEPALKSGPSEWVAHAQLDRGSVPIVLDGFSAVLNQKPKPRVSVVDEPVANGPFGRLIDARASFLLKTGARHQEARRVLLVIGDASKTIDLDFDANGKASLTLSDHMRLQGDPQRMLISLLAPDVKTKTGRAVATATAWIWPDLTSVVGGHILKSSTKPQNIAWQRCRHIMTSETGDLCLDPSGGYIEAILAFDTDQGKADFSIPWPDVCLTRVSSSGDVTVLAMGSRLVLGHDDRLDSIAISCPNEEASLIVLGRYEPKPFAQSSRRVLSMRDLTGFASDTRVLIEDASGIQRILFEVVPALEPTNFSATRLGGRLKVQFWLPVRVDALRLDTECEAGSTSTSEVSLGYRPLDAKPAEWMKAELDSADPHTVRASIDLGEFQHGIVMARLSVRPLNKNTFLPLVSQRGDVFGLALASPNGEPVSITALRPDRRSRFLKLAQWMTVCFAEQCWHQVGPVLASRWRRLGETLVGLPDGAGTLLEAAFLPTADDAPPSWVPLAHPLDIKEDLYAAPAHAFSRLKKVDAPGAAEFAEIASLTSTWLSTLRQVSPIAFMGFSNVAQAQRTGEKLTGFSINKYFAVLISVDTDASAGWFWRGGDLLGPAHWRAAHLAFMERLEDVGLGRDDRNPERLTAMKRLVNAVYQIADSPPPAPMNPDDPQGENLLLRWSTAFFHCFARACRKNEVTAFIDTFAKALERPHDLVVRDISFLVRLGPELFAFYLMIHELERAHPHGA